MPAEAKKQLNPLLKLALEMGPLILFFFANSRPGLFLPFIGPLLPATLAGEKAGIFVATAVFMVAILIALAVSYALTRHLPVMAMVTAVVVVVFGTLTLVLHDETFIKMKPTIIYVLFGGILLGGLWFNKPLLAIVFDSMFDLTRGRLAQAHVALGGLLPRARGAERDRLAHPDDRFLGQLQGVRRGAADVYLRGVPVSAAAEIRDRPKDE